MLRSCRANLAFAAPQLNADLRLSKTQYGLGSGLFFIGEHAHTST